MPLEEADLKLVEEKVSAKLAEALKPVNELADKVTKLQADLPGLTKRLATDATAEQAKAIEELKALVTKEPKPGKQPEPKPDDRIAKLEEELKQRDKRAKQAELKAQLSAELAKQNLVTGAADDYLGTLMAQVKESDDGKRFMTVKRKLESTGEEIDENVSVEIGVKKFFEVRPWVKAAAVKSGAGAGSSGGGASESDPFDGATYGDLLKNPTAMAAALKKDPARVAKLRAENDKARK